MDAENKINSTPNDITISVDAERSVLGAILVNNDTIIPVSSVIKAEDFYEEAHRIIYTAMLDVYTKSMPIDLIVLSEQIKTMTNIEEIGGAGYITSLSTNVDFSKNAEYYA
ncbi:DnaB-like helicase N-terminal domain-containing protein, partial [Criibacterium bergeronii]